MVLAAIGSAVGIAGAVASVIERLDGTRSVIIEVQNHTPLPLRVDNHHHSSGGFMEPPNQEIPPGMVDIYGSQDRGLFTGTLGGVTYDSDADLFLHVAWANPFVGSNECRSQVFGGQSAAFRTTSLSGSGDVNAHMKFEIRQWLDLRFVRSPDYIWTRLHGYAVAPEASAENRAAFGVPLVPLHSWYDPNRGDNWATTDPMYTDPVATELSPSYRHYRHEGWVVSPSVGSQPSGTLPLHSWWSPTFEDNFATTSPVHTRPLTPTIPPDYTAYRLEGFLFSPDQPPPRGTIPVHHWYSGSRGDNFVSSQEGWRP